MRWPRTLAGYSSAAAGASDARSAAQTSPDLAAAAPRCAPARRKKRYTGRRIDLDFKDADIHNILRLLADVGGGQHRHRRRRQGRGHDPDARRPLGPGARRRARGQGLGQVREGNLIRVAPLAVLEKERELEIARQKQITEVLPTETRLIPVSYADAEELQDRAKDLLSPRGKIAVDERTNMLIVSDVARNLALIEELVRNLDTQTPQVLIEARIVEARSTFVRQSASSGAAPASPTPRTATRRASSFPYNVGVGGGASDGNTPLEGLVPAPLGHRRGQPELRRQPAGRGRHRKRRRDRLDPRLGRGHLQPQPAPVGPRDRAARCASSRRPRISTLDNIEAVDRAGRLHPDLGGQRAGRANRVRGRQAQAHRQAARHQRRAR